MHLGEQIHLEGTEFQRKYQPRQGRLEVFLPCVCVYVCVCVIMETPFVGGTTTLQNHFILGEQGKFNRAKWWHAFNIWWSHLNKEGILHATYSRTFY